MGKTNLSALDIVDIVEVDDGDGVGGPARNDPLRLLGRLQHILNTIMPEIANLAQINKK